MDQELLPRTSTTERSVLEALEEDGALVDWPLIKETSIPANFRSSLIHLETIELDTSTYGWIKLNGNWERLFSTGL